MSDDKPSLVQALSDLTDALTLREKYLDAREEELKKAEERFKVDKCAFYVDTGPSDVLHTNIGGTKTTVLRRTLTSVPGSMLAAKFSGRCEDSIEEDKDGNFLINQEHSVFHPALKYLRNKKNGIEKYSCYSLNASDGRKNVYRMVEYYGMTDDIYPTTLKICKGPDDSVEVISPRKVNTKEFTTFQLAGVGHNRSVKSYEVTLGDNVQKLQIGWKFSDEAVKVHEKNRDFLGDIGDKDTFALDVTKSDFLLEGNRIPICCIDYKKGTAIRSEDQGRIWYVDGEAVHPSSRGKFKLSYKGAFPLISIKGEMEITYIELDAEVY
jgi:hypothetical protein